jgi:hypothetical protein
MKRVVAAVGVCAVGATGLQGQNVAGLTREEARKSWSVTALLRPFYDDNSLNQTEGNEEAGFGVEFSPGVSVNLPLERTLFAASYRLTLNYYEARPENNLDQDHEFIARLNHKFSQRYEVDLKDTFVYSDAPEVLDRDTAQTTVNRRQDSTGFRNNAVLDFSARLTPTIGTTLGYKNNLRDYLETGVGSLSALLDQVEHLFHIDGQWFAAKNTMMFVGYQIGLADYTSSDLIGTYVTIDQATGSIVVNEVPASTRNNLSHYLYVGGRREFTRLLQGAASVGLQYVDFYNADETSLSPYVDLTATYAYLPGSYARLGLTIQRNSTDSGLATDGSLTLDQESASVYAGVTHRITPRIHGALLGRYQHSVYNGGEFDGESDNYFTFDMNFNYKIRENLYADTGYLWTRAVSSRPDSGYTRNRVYIGLRAVF